MDSIGSVSKEILGPEKAPDSQVARLGLLALKGLSNTPSGMEHAIVEDLKHPLQTIGMVAGATAVGFLAKTALPKAGIYGELGCVALAAYAFYRASDPIGDSLNIAAQAKTMNDINVAGKLLGDVSGSFIVNSALSGAAYQWGSMSAEQVFGMPFSGKAAAQAGLEAAAKANFWSRAVSPRIPLAFGMTAGSSTFMIFEPRLSGIEKFAPSEQTAPGGEFTGRTGDRTPLSVTVQLKSKASDAELVNALNDIVVCQKPYLSDEEIAEKFGPSKESFAQVEKFAQSYGLTVGQEDSRTGRVVLNGTAAQFSEAFKTQLYQYNLNGESTRERSGAVFVPKNIAKNIEGVFGLDDRPQARLHNLDPVLPSAESGTSVQKASYRADEVAGAYNFPQATSGKGQSAAIVELGGGIDLKNEAAYYKENSLKMPEIKVVALQDQPTSTGRNYRADKEVSLDSQIIGTVAPDARQTIIFARNNEQGFIDAIARGSFPESNEANNQALSISWGQPIEAMSEQGKRGMDLVLKKAALKGVSVFAATGDDGAADGINDGSLHVDFPASNPYVTAVGGTSLLIKDGKIASETVWNDDKGITGGGISGEARPDFQKDLRYQWKELSGRALPDISGNASMNSGYKIRSNGDNVVDGGTSAVAPLYTALALRLNEGLGGGKTVGYMNPFLYKQGLENRNSVFNDVVKGNNKGYEAGVGWDPASGWGSVNGEKLLQAYKQADK